MTIRRLIELQDEANRKMLNTLTKPWVPLTIRDRSRVATWLWLRCPRMSYETGCWLARWLP